MDMNAVEDKSSPCVAAAQGDADGAGFAALKRRHRIEQMGEAGRTCGQQGLDGIVRGGRMTDADGHAGIAKRLYVCWRGLFRRKRYNHWKRPLLRQQAHVIGIERTKKPLRVDAASLRRQPGAFEVKAEQSRHGFAHAALNCRDCSSHLAAIVGDQRRHDRGDAELGMRVGDCLQCLDRRGVVEHCAAAAIDLDIDEPRGEKPLKQGCAR